MVQVGVLERLYFKLGRVCIATNRQNIHCKKIEKTAGNHCELCGRPSLFNGSRQKVYIKRDFQPKYSEFCTDRRRTDICCALFFNVLQKLPGREYRRRIVVEVYCSMVCSGYSAGRHAYRYTTKFSLIPKIILYQNAPKMLFRSQVTYRSEIF